MVIKQLNKALGRVVIVAATLFCTGTLFAAPVYQCVDKKGSTTFSDRPCSPSAVELENQSTQSAKSSAQSDSGQSGAKKPSAKKTPPKRTGWGGYIDRARNIGGE